MKICSLSQGILLAGLFLLLAFVSTSHGQGRHDSVFETGGSAPGGFSFVDFRAAQFNNQGDLLFQSAIDTTGDGQADSEGLYLGNVDGSIDLVAQNGQFISGSEYFSSLGGFYSLSSSGQVAFDPKVANVAGGSNTSIFKYDGNLSEIARVGDSYSGGNFSYLESPAINGQGEVSYYGGLTGSPNFHGLFRGSNTTIRSLAVEGQSIPGSGGDSFGSFDKPAALNHQGGYGFHAAVNLAGGGYEERIHYRNPAGSFTEIARQQQAAPGFGGGQFGSFHSTVDVNDQGEVGFYASMNNGGVSGRGFFRGNGSNLVAIARQGQLTPTGDGTFAFSNQADPLINNLGQVAFQMAVENSSQGNIQGIFRGDGNTLVEIARYGRMVGPDEQFSFVGLMLGLNEPGQVLFEGGLQQIGSSSNDDAILIGDGTDLMVVAREGQQIGTKVIDSAVAAIAGRHGTPLNDFGQVAYWARFTDGSEGIQVWTPDLNWRSNQPGSWDDASHWTLSQNPEHVHNVTLATDANTTILGPQQQAQVRNLFLGGGNGNTTLQLQNGGSIDIGNEMFINATGTLTGDGRIDGYVSNYGTIIADNVGVDTGTLFNFGTIRGHGRLDAQLINANGGEIRVAAGETMQLDGASIVNLGRIENLGGQLEINTTAVNRAGSGMISGRDATMRFNRGLSNDGSLAFSHGVNDVFGDINNRGVISVAGGAHVTFHDDLTQNGILEVMAAGSTRSTAVLFGWDGAGGFTGGGDVFVAGDLRPGNSPASVLMDGNLSLGATAQTVIELGGKEIGEFDQLRISGDFAAGGGLSVELIDGFQLTFNDEFLIAEVGGQLNGQFGGLDEGALVGNYGGHDLFISYSAGDGNDVGLFTAIPEPGTGTFLLLGLIGLAGYRRNRARSSR